MKKIKWLDDKTIQIDIPKKTKKVTGTRFASILGKNVWSTPFEMWLAITKTFEEPFEDTIYTIAGKNIEPKQAEYMKENYLMDNIVSPADIYGEDYFNKTWGDFFKDNKYFGGMWDYLLYDKDGKVSAVLEMKTTKRAEDWLNEIPEYYALQASLYAYLLNVEDVYMVATFLEPKDYENSENFIVNSDNTVVKHFKLHERYPNFEKYIKEVENWWINHVETGKSPEYDEVKDKELLKALKTNNISVDDIDNIDKLIEKAEELQFLLDKEKENFSNLEKELKAIKDTIKEKMISKFEDGKDKVILKGKIFIWSVGKSETVTIDKKKLEEDGLLDKYSSKKEQYRLTLKEVEDKE